MTRKTLILATALLAGSSGLVLADSTWREKQIDSTQWRESREIEEGRYKGQLTRREYRDLLAEQARIREMERAAKADGHVSSREFRQIRSAQVSAERHIQAESHDGQKSWWRRFLYLNRY